MSFLNNKSKVLFFIIIYLKTIHTDLRNRLVIYLRYFRFIWFTHHTANRRKRGHQNAHVEIVFEHYI